MSDCILEMTGIKKAFSGIKALDGVEIHVKEGEIHALMGENGAGKSTFMKILNGLLQPDDGKIVYQGKEVAIESPAVALKMGIAMIYQELNPIKDMTVAENIFMGRELTYGKSCFVNSKRSYEEAQSIIKKFGLTVSAKSKMRELSIAQMQMIEIVKAVSIGAKVIVMDEPTSSLTDEEIKVLFHKIKELKKGKVAVIYISHRLEEIFEIADTATVMRDGQYIGTKKITELDKNQLIHMMVGRDLDNVFPKTFAEIKDTVLKVDNFTSKRKFRNINFEVKAGEILGFYGLVGAGRSEVFRAVFGLDSADEGTMYLNGKETIIKSPKDAISHGIAMVTEDRKDTGLVLCRSIKENIALPNLNEFCQGIFINQKKETEKSIEMADKITVKMSGMEQLAGNLSGGNQQKVVLSKWLIKNPKLLILDEPTRGIDVGAKAEIHTLMCEFAKMGMAIVMISSELPEIMGMSDRVLVMGEGEIRKEFKYGEYSQDEILKYALGGKENNEK